MDSCPASEADSLTGSALRAVVCRLHTPLLEVQSKNRLIMSVRKGLRRWFLTWAPCSWSSVDDRRPLSQMVLKKPFHWNLYCWLPWKWGCLCHLHLITAYSSGWLWETVHVLHVVLGSWWKISSKFPDCWMIYHYKFFLVISIKYKTFIIYSFVQLLRLTLLMPTIHLFERSIQAWFWQLLL